MPDKCVSHSYAAALKAALDFLQLGHSVGLGNVDDDVVDALEEQIKQALSQPTGPSGEVIVTEAMIEAGKDERMACFRTEGRESNPISVGEALTRIYRAMAKSSPLATDGGNK